MKIKQAQPTTRVRIRKSVTGATPQATSLRSVHLNSGVPPILDLRKELDETMDEEEEEEEEEDEYEEEEEEENEEDEEDKNDNFDLVDI